ncbi:MAG: tetratricopeptide repeat protein [Candidatus Latescibacterota bacterium]|nr:tetratricopeptide repeat protein [Candidatus Latescibacterota bacterium]
MLWILKWTSSKLRLLRFVSSQNWFTVNLLLFTLGMTGCAGNFFGKRVDSKTSSESQHRAMQYFIQAKVFESQENYLGAIVSLRSALDLGSDSATLYAQLAYNYSRIDDWNMVVHFAKGGLERRPSDGSLRRFLIRALENIGSRKEAAEQLRTLLDYEEVSWPLYRHLAYLYLDTGQSELIGPLFERVLSDRNTSNAVRTDIATVYARIDVKDRAEQIFREVLIKDPYLEDAWLGLADLLLSQGRRQEGLKVYRKASRQLPESALPIYYLSRMIVSDFDLEEILDQESPSFLYRLGVALSDADKLDLAEIIFRHIVIEKPNTTRGWLELGQYYVYSEQYDLLDQIMRQALVAMPDSSELSLFWAATLERRNQFEKADKIYEEALLRETEEKRIFLYWGASLEERGKWEDAIDVYGQGLRSVGLDVELLLRSGICLGQLEHWLESLELYEQAWHLEQMQGQVALQWGIALQQLRRWDQAIEKLQVALEKIPDQTSILFYLGMCYERASQEKNNEKYFWEGEALFERLIEIDPDDAFALNYLGYMYAEKGVKLEMAVGLLLRAVEINPKNSAFLDSLAWAYFRMGNVESAAEYIAKAIEQIDGDEGIELAVIFDHAGDVSEAIGDVTAARKHWLRALEIDQGNDLVRSKLER